MKLTWMRVHLSGRVCEKNGVKNLKKEEIVF